MQFKHSYPSCVMGQSSSAGAFRTVDHVAQREMCHLHRARDPGPTADELADLKPNTPEFWP